MTMLREACARVQSFFRKRQLDLELDEELAAHIELATEDHIRQGMGLPEARRLARIELGGIDPMKELHRDSRGLPWLEGIIQDVRHSIRGLRHSPGFTLTAIATLAIGIGVNVAVFTVTNAMLFKGFPLVERNDRILYIGSGGPGYAHFVSYPDFEDWRTQSKTFKGMGAVEAVRVNVSDQSGFPESYEATRVSATAFQLLGQRPIIGRDFVPSDEAPGAAPVAILSYGLWERRHVRKGIQQSSARRRGCEWRCNHCDRSHGSRFFLPAESGSMDTADADPGYSKPRSSHLMVRFRPHRRRRCNRERPRGNGNYREPALASAYPAYKSGLGSLQHKISMTSSSAPTRP